jgi:hypothetical protein
MTNDTPGIGYEDAEQGAREILTRILNWYNADEKHWVKRINFGKRPEGDEDNAMPEHSADNADCACLFGATLMHGLPPSRGSMIMYEAERRAKIRLRTVIRSEVGLVCYSSSTTIVNFNDMHRTTLKDVKRVLMKAIELENVDYGEA